MSCVGVFMVLIGSSPFVGQIFHVCRSLSVQNRSSRHHLVSVVDGGSCNRLVLGGSLDSSSAESMLPSIW